MPNVNYGSANTMLVVACISHRADGPVSLRITSEIGLSRARDHWAVFLDSYLVGALYTDSTGRSKATNVVVFNRTTLQEVLIRTVRALENLIAAANLTLNVH